jgi:AraC-like DNA-binding protein
MQTEAREEMAKYRMLKAEGILADYVRFFWTLDVEVGNDDPFIHRTLPDNCVELIFYCKGKLSIRSTAGEEGSTFTSGVFGQLSSFRQFKTSEDFKLFGVYLYPYSLRVLFGLPASELTDERIDSATIWGPEGSILEEKVLSATTFDARVQFVSEFLLKKIASIRNNENVFTQQIKRVADSSIVRSINSFAHDCNLSRRQFERKFKDLSGFSPKDFLNIARFKYALTEIEHGSNSLAQIAINAGYYDQSHFSNEFKKFSGYTPKEFILNLPPSIDMRATRDFKD